MEINLLYSNSVIQEMQTVTPETKAAPKTNDHFSNNMMENITTILPTDLTHACQPSFIIRVIVLR